MKRISYALLLPAALSFSGCVSVERPAAEGEQSRHGGDGVSQMLEATARSTREIERAVAKVKPALVRIKVVEPDYHGGREEKAISFGSGTIISPDGYVVTNHHVAGKGVQIVCTMENREEIPAVLVGTDPATDIAVIRLMPTRAMVFPHASFGDSDAVKVGDSVLALGSPLAISQSVTQGILANTEMISPPTFRGYDFELDGESVGELVRWLGHDAAIFPGNSGGPLINMAGEIIGVNEIGMGLGGAIPGNLAEAVALEIIARGHVERAFLGVRLQPLLKSSPTGERGVLIGSVTPDKPAAAAGLQPGDILLAINGEPVEGRFAEQLPAINNRVAHLTVGQPATVRVYRDGGEMELQVTPEAREPAVLPTTELREWGITARNLSQAVRVDLALEATEGVLVTSTNPGGPVSKARPDIRPSDVIVEVNGQPVRQVAELEALTATIVGEEEKLFPTLVLFEREGERMLTVIDVGIDRLQPPAREVEKAWLPIETQVVTREIARQLGEPDLKGVRISRVHDEAPEGFPLQLGDIITHLDEEALDAARPEDAELFNTWIRQYKIGTEVAFRLKRGAEIVTASAVLGGSPRQAREMTRWRDLDFEFVVREATFRDRAKPTRAGARFHVIVDGVTAGGWADLGGLMVGDALLEIDGRPVESLGDVEAAMQAARDAKASQVVLFVRRETRTEFIELEPAW